MKNYIFCLILPFLISCTGTLKKSWDINDFSKKKTFTIVSEGGKSYSTAIIKIKGNVDKRICFTLDEAYGMDWCNYFNSKDSEIEFNTDFYGVGEFKLYMLPSSNVNGDIRLTIELPYTIN